MGSLRAGVLMVCMATGCGRMGFDLLGDRAPDARLSDGMMLENADATIDVPTDTPTVPVAFSQKSSTGSGVGPQTLTLSTASTPGTMLVLSMGANSITSLGLPSGWIVAVSTGFSGACYALIAYYPNNPGGITQVMYTQPAGLPNVAVVSEVSGVTALDAIGSINNMSNVTMQSVTTSGPTSTDRGIAITTFCEDVNNPTYTSGAGWTNISQFATGAASTSFNTDYKEFTAVGVVSETVTSSTNGKYAAVIATFR